MADTDVETEIHITKDTPLFGITLRVQRMPHRGRTWANATLVILRSGQSPHTYHWPDFLDLNTLQFGAIYQLPDMRDMSVMDALARTYEADRIKSELFTKDECDAILAWFERHPYPGTTIDVQPPVLGNYGPVDMGGVGGPADLYCFEKEQGFDCPIPFQGYYDVSGCPPYKDDGTLDESYWHKEDREFI